MDELGFETLLEINHSTNRWYPQSITTYRNSIKLRGYYEVTYPLKSNFAYSMQYIEYLEKQISELTLSDVILTMLYKSYIITAMSIIEGLFVNLLHDKQMWNTTTWEERIRFSTNPKIYNGEKAKIETIVFQECDEKDMRMDLDSMIKKIEKHHLLSINHTDFPALKKLRELRNRVHLQLGENTYDHDYNCFGYEQVQMARRILYAVLTADEFCRNPETFKFIKDIYDS